MKPKAKRAPADFYPTPRSAFAPLLRLRRLPSKRVVFHDPAEGDRRLVNWLVESGRAASGADLFPQLGGIPVDFIKTEISRDFIITNPPFSLALEFCAQSLRLAPEVLLLLRLNFLASRKRREWWQENEPNALFVLSERPSFSADRRTDMTDYAWFYWGRRFSGIHHL